VQAGRVFRADSDAEREAAAGDEVEARGGVRELHWLAQGREEDAGAEPHAARARGGVGQRSEHLEARAGKQAVAHPHRVVAERFRAFGDREDARAVLGLVAGDEVARRQHDTEAHAVGRGASGLVHRR
jgi:hypothetical protein